MSVCREDVERARAVLAGRIHRTPTFGSSALGVSLKAELFQKTGSFKARGALNRLAALTPEERERGVVTWSAGNHAQAVAWAAAEEGVDCLVQMWEGVSPLKVEATRGYGATVDLSPPDPAAAYDRVLEIVEEQGRVFVHPHSDPLVVAGHGTLALELLEDVPDARDRRRRHRRRRPGLRHRHRARRPRARRRRRAGARAGLPGGPRGRSSVRVGTDTIADGLAPPFAGELPLELCRGKVETVLVTEDEIARGDAIPLRAREARVRAGGRGGGRSGARGQGRAGPRTWP